MKNNLIVIIIILFSHLFKAQNKIYSLYDGKELNQLSITNKEIKFNNKDGVVIYTVEKQNPETLKVNNDSFSFSISFEKKNIIKILPFNLLIKTNSDLYKYLKESILNKNEIQKLGLLFYPVNRFYDDCCLYFNHDIFIKDWDQDMYSTKFKIFSIEELNEKKVTMRGVYQYKGDTLDKINYYRDAEGSLFEFYSEKLTNPTAKYNQYTFKYYPSNEKYILTGKHFRNKNGRVMKAVFNYENMADTSKSNTKTLNYPYPKVKIN